MGTAVFSIISKTAQHGWDLAQFKMSVFPSVSFLIVDFFFSSDTVAREWEVD